MKRLRIDLDELLLALSSSGGLGNFLDRTTGEILVRWEDAPDVDGIDARLAAGPDERYEAIEPVPSRERFEVMVDFAECLPDSALKKRLLRALQQRKPFRGFRDALFDDEAVRQRWFAFERAAATQAAERWLASLGIEVEWTTVVSESGPAES
jgi:hypothetical protein